MAPNAGWYTDPGGSGGLRWWDGQAWTDRCSGPQPEPPPSYPPVSSGGALRTLGNVLWLVLAGVWLAIGYVVAGVINCLTVIGIPFGVQAFKLAGYALWPFGRAVVERPGRDAGLSCLGNVIWFVFGGFWMALGHLIAGLLLCLTIVGIPLGLGCIKMAGLAIAPFGKEVVSVDEMRRRGYAVTGGFPPLGR